MSIKFKIKESFKKILDFIFKAYCALFSALLKKIIFIVPNNKAFQKEIKLFKENKENYNKKFHEKLEKDLSESKDTFKFMDDFLKKAENKNIEIKSFEDFKKYINTQIRSSKQTIEANLIQIIGGYNLINDTQRKISEKKIKQNKEEALKKAYKKIENLFAKGYGKAKNDHQELKDAYRGNFFPPQYTKGLEFNYVIDDKIDELVLYARDKNNSQQDNGKRQIIIHFFGMLGLTMGHEKHFAKIAQFMNKIVGQPIDHVWPNFPQENINSQTLIDHHEKIIKYYLDLGYKPENIILSGHCLGGGISVETIDRFKNKGIKFKAYINMISYDKVINLASNLFNEKFSYNKFICKDYISGSINADKIHPVRKIVNLILNIITWLLRKFISNLCKFLCNYCVPDKVKKEWEMDGTKILNKDFPAETIAIMNLCNEKGEYKDELINYKLSLVKSFYLEKDKNNSLKKLEIKDSEQPKDSLSMVEIYQDTETGKFYYLIKYPTGNNLWNHYANDEDALLVILDIIYNLYPKEKFTLTKTPVLNCALEVNQGMNCNQGREIAVC